jgi:hypothetical protein
MNKELTAEQEDYLLECWREEELNKPIEKLNPLFNLYSKGDKK